MKYQINKYTEDDFARWDDYVWNSDNGTMFHTRQFLSYHPPGRFEDHSLFINSKDSVKALFPAIELQMDKDKVLYSHRGSSYGSFVYKDVGIKGAFSLVENLQDYAKQQNFNKILLTTPPLVYMNKYSNYIDFALIQNGFRYLRREISSIVQLPAINPAGSEKTADTVLSMFRREARTATRKSIKAGIQIRISNDYDSYYDILKQNLMLRHNVNPTHSLDELKKLVELFPERIHLWGAYLEEKLIAGVVNFITTDNVVLAFYISDDKTYQEFRPVNQLFYRIFSWAIENNFKFYDFGIFTVNMDPNWGLGKFKESFGARGLFRDTFELLL